MNAHTIGALFSLAVSPARRLATSRAIEEERAWNGLLTVSGPAAIEVATAEVDRRWQLHVERARATPLALQPKTAIIESVCRDVAAGLL